MSFFSHQRVFCPSKQVVEPLWPIPSSQTSPGGGDLWPYLGKEVEPRVAAKVADGTLHPSSKQPWAEALLVDGRERAKHGHRLTKSRESARHAEPRVDNVWNALVYSSEDGEGREDASRQRDKENSRTGGERQRPGKHSFCFFPPQRVDGSSEQIEGARAASRADKDSRPPLREIYVGSSKSRQSSYVPPPSHKDVPIHFGDYSSRLVGRSFKPISRKRKRNEVKLGTRSSQFVAKLMQNAERHRPPPALPNMHEEEDEEERPGNEMFRGDRRADTHSDVFTSFSSEHNNDVVSLRGMGFVPPVWQTHSRSDFPYAADGGTIGGGCSQQYEQEHHPWQEMNQEPCLDSYGVFADSRYDYLDGTFDAVAAHEAERTRFAERLDGQPDLVGDVSSGYIQTRAPRPQTGTFSLCNRVSCYSRSECAPLDQDTQQFCAFDPLQSAYKPRPGRSEREEVTVYK